MDGFSQYYAMAQEYLADASFQEYGVLGLFANSLLSATAIPFPTEVLTSALLMGGESELNVSLALIIGSVIGGFLNYSIGLSGNKIVNFFKGKKHSHEVELSDEMNHEKSRPELETSDGKKSHKFLTKFGWAGIFFASWIPFLGDLVLISAGAKKMNFKKFTLFMVAGKIFKTVVVVMSLGAVFV